MSLSRRGFLGVLSTAMVGAVVYNPDSMLWVPKVVQAAGGVEPATADLVSTNLSMTEIDRIVNKRGELNELALLCAKRLGERMEHNPAIRLREVMYRQVGHVRVDALPPNRVEDRESGIAIRFVKQWDINVKPQTDPDGIETENADDVDVAGSGVSVPLDRHEDRQLWLDVEDEGKGRFEGKPSRTVMTKPMHRNFDALSWELTGELAYGLGGFSMFAPLGLELRPGDAFDDKMLIGTAVDPVTGLSVRVLSFDHQHQRGNAQPMAMLEVAGGWWKPRSRGADALKPARKLSL